MFCPNCGLQNNDNAASCTHCGAPLPTTPPKKQPLLIRLFKAIIAGLLAVTVFFGCQFIVIFGYAGIYTANMVISGEIPTDVEFTDPILNTVTEQILTEVNENTTQILLVSNLLTILILCLSYSLKKRSPIAEMNVNGINIMRYVGFAIFGIALQVFVTVTLSLLPISQAIIDNHNEAFEGLGNTGNLALELLSTGLITGITEELVFRGVVLNKLRRVIPSAAAVIVSAVVFGLVHSSLLSMIYATVLGLVLGALFVRFDSVVPPMIAHVFFNMTSSLLVLIPETGAMLLVGLYITSIPLIFYLCRSLFVRYPTVSDLLLDGKNRIKPKNKYEAAVISEMNALKESGEINEADYKRLEQDWENAKKFLPPYRAPKHGFTEINENDNENGGNSNEAL